MTVSVLLWVTIPETPVTVTVYVPFGVSGFHCEFPPEPHPVAPNSSTQLNASPARSCSRRRDLKENANPNRSKAAAGMKSPGDVTIDSGHVWGVLISAVVKVVVGHFAVIGQLICGGTFWQVHAIVPLKLFIETTCIVPFHVEPCATVTAGRVKSKSSAGGAGIVTLTGK